MNVNFKSRKYDMIPLCELLLYYKKSDKLYSASVCEMKIAVTNQLHYELQYCSIPHHSHFRVMHQFYQFTYKYSEREIFAEVSIISKLLQICLQ